MRRASRLWVLYLCAGSVQQDVQSDPASPRTRSVDDTWNVVVESGGPIARAVSRVECSLPRILLRSGALQPQPASSGCRCVLSFLGFRAACIQRTSVSPGACLCPVARKCRSLARGAPEAQSIEAVDGLCLPLALPMCPSRGSGAIIAEPAGWTQAQVCRNSGAR